MKSALRVRVVTGRHAGATQAIDQKAFVIGSSLESDIVLTDASVFARHAKLTPDDNAIELEALEGDIIVGAEIIRAGSKVKTQYPVRCALGAAEIEVSGAPSPHKSSVVPLMQMGGFALVTLLAASKIYFDVPGRGGNIESRADQLVAAAALQKPQLLPGKLAETAANSLSQHLLSIKIDSISVKAGAGTVSATGTIDPERMNDWRSIQVWFDENFGQKIVLQSEVNALPRKPVKSPVTIQSVWYGKSPYFIDGDGNKHFEGAMLRDGWILQKIDEDKILISKNNQPMVLRF